MKITFTKPLNVLNENEAVFLPQNFSCKAMKLDVVTGGTSSAKSWNNIVFRYEGVQYRIGANALYVLAKAKLEPAQLKKLFDVNDKGMGSYIGEMMIGFDKGQPFFAAK
jgi:hypothetical protein